MPEGIIVPPLSSSVSMAAILLAKESIIFLPNVGSGVKYARSL